MVRSVKKGVNCGGWVSFVIGGGWREGEEGEEAAASGGRGEGEGKGGGEVGGGDVWDDMVGKVGWLLRGGLG